ncbi:hypothetical protein N310_10319, partial [Acanthisitta chloris]
LLDEQLTLNPHPKIGGIVVYERVSPQSYLKPIFPQFGKHFCHIGKLDGIKIKIPIGLGVHVINLDVAAVKTILLDLFGKSQKLILVDIILVEGPRGPDGVSEGILS